MVNVITVPCKRARPSLPAPTRAHFVGRAAAGARPRRVNCDRACSKLRPEWPPKDCRPRAPWQGTTSTAASWLEGGRTRDGLRATSTESMLPCVALRRISQPFAIGNLALMLPGRCTLPSLPCLLMRVCVAGAGTEETECVGDEKKASVDCNLLVGPHVGCSCRSSSGGGTVSVTPSGTFALMIV